MTTQTLERAEGVAKINAANQKIKAAIEDAGGVFNVQMAVRRLLYIDMFKTNIFP